MIAWYATGPPSLTIAGSRGLSKLSTLAKETPTGRLEDIPVTATKARGLYYFSPKMEASNEHSTLSTHKLGQHRDSNPRSNRSIVTPSHDTPRRLLGSTSDVAKGTAVPGGVTKAAQSQRKKPPVVRIGRVRNRVRLGR